MHAGVTAQNGFVSLTSEACGNTSIGPKHVQMRAHLCAIARNQIAGSRLKERFAIFPRGAPQWNAARQRFEHSNRGDAGQQTSVRAPWNVDRATKLRED